MKLFTSFIGLLSLLQTAYVEAQDSEQTNTCPPRSIPTTIPKPYAEPKGFSDDITAYLAPTDASEVIRAKKGIFFCISPSIPKGSLRGSVLAAPSGPDFPNNEPDYTYHWPRDSATGMNIVQQLYNASTNASATKQYEQAMFDYANVRTIEQNIPHLLAGLGEPRFYMNQTRENDFWARPENDGPPLTAIVLIAFANSYIAKNKNDLLIKDKVWPPLQKDLQYIASNWSDLSYGPWEQYRSQHFFIRMIQRKALIEGVALAKRLGDNQTAASIAPAIQPVTDDLAKFWNPAMQTVQFAHGPVEKISPSLPDRASRLDISVIMGVYFGRTDDDVFTYTNDQILATLTRLVTSFIPFYPLAKIHTDVAGRVLGSPQGLFPEDLWNGTGVSCDGGNPWTWSNFYIAHHLYSIVDSYRCAGSIVVTNTSKPFFDYFAPDAHVTVGKISASSPTFATVTGSLEGWGDAFVRTIKQYTGAN